MIAKRPDKQVVNRDSKGRFMPGASPNPKGRPKKDYSVTSLVKEMLDDKADERWLHLSDYGLTWRQAIAKALLVGAVRGQPVAIKELLDRLEGKATQPIVGERGEPIVIKAIEVVGA